jgi:hypothetical protein
VYLFAAYCGIEGDLDSSDPGSCAHDVEGPLSAKRHYWVAASGGLDGKVGNLFSGNGKVNTVVGLLLGGRMVFGTGVTTAGGVASAL